MKVENLSVGMIVKNYPELCKLLEVEEKTSNSKKSQLKEMERLFSYTKSGHSFTITEIFEKPKDKEIGSRKGIYNDIAQLLIMDLLSQNKGNIIVTKTELTKKIGLTNENYTLGYRHQDKMSKYLDIDDTTLGDFYKVNTSSISKIIDNAISGLQRKFIIDTQEILMIQYYREDKPRPASVFDRDLIQTINKEALITLGLTEIDIKNRNADYYKFTELRDKIINYRTQIKNHYYAMDIVINHTYIKNEMSELSGEILNQLERENKLKELNNTYANKVIVKADKRHNEAIDLSSKEELSEILLARFSDLYVNKFKKMTNYLIKIDAPLIDRNRLFDKSTIQLSNDEIERINDSLPFS